MSNICFASVAFGERYIEQQDRLKASILNIYPDANLMFWRGELPQGSRSMKESLYGFKVHAINSVTEKTKVVFLDPACILIDKCDYWFDLHIPVMVVKDDNLLVNTISDKALKEYGNPDITGWHLVGGSLYVFDFAYQRADDIFISWYVAELNGLFGSQKEAANEEINKHRNDESCMAMALYMNGVEPVAPDVVGYGSKTVIKKHFK